MTPDARRKIEHGTLAAILVGVMVVSIMVFVGYGRFKTGFSPNKRYSEILVDAPKYKPWDQLRFKPLLGQIQTPPIWTRDDQVRMGHQVFTARLIKWDPASQQAAWVDLNYETIGGLPYWWLRRYNFPTEDPTIASKDPDQDQFTNAEEYQWEQRLNKGLDFKDAAYRTVSSPINPKQHPDWINKLKYRRFDQQKFALLFREYNEISGKTTFQINFINKRKRPETAFLTQGESFSAIDGQYTVVKFTKKITKELDPSVGMKLTKDKSELLVKSAEAQEFVLIVGKPDATVIKTGDFEFPLAKDKNKRRFTLKPGETFELEGSKYKVIDIDSKKAKIQELVNNEEFEIDITR